MTVLVIGQYMYYFPLCLFNLYFILPKYFYIFEPACAYCTLKNIFLVNKQIRQNITLDKKSYLRKFYS